MAGQRGIAFSLFMLALLVNAPLFAQAPPTAQGPPIGSMMPYAGEITAESEAALKAQGWLPCDGRALRATDPATGQATEYAKLFAIIRENYGAGYEEGAVDKAGKKGDFNLPDVRGRFLRGVDAGTARDPDRAKREAMRHGGNSGDEVGSVQSDDFESHDHGASGHNAKSVFWSAPIGVAEMKRGFTPGGDFYDNGQNGVSRGGQPVNVTVEARGGHETRPVNISVNWIIRYK